jgi:ABC-type siderophore export system fused ATPase/permease subunit
LIAAVFWGYHLFRHLYGIPSPDMTEEDRLLSNSNCFGERASSTASLASGTYPTVGAGTDLQENRPALFCLRLDRYAGPKLRKKFYHEVLPERRGEGNGR